jgi:hypothetical protein
MQPKQRAVFFVLIALLVLTGVGLAVTTEWRPRGRAQRNPLDLDEPAIAG